MIKIRQARLKDATDLLAIYQPYVEKTVITFEDRVPSISIFQQRMKKIMTDYPYLVAIDEDKKIIGYAYAHAYRERAAYDRTVEVSIYLEMENKGKGVGNQLYEALEKELLKLDKAVLLACITASNEVSLIFHEKMGYKTVGTMTGVGVKFAKWHDITWMEKRLS